MRSAKKTVSKAQSLSKDNSKGYPELLNDEYVDQTSPIGSDPKY